MYKHFGEEKVTVVPSIGRWVPLRNVEYPERATKENSEEVKGKFGMWPAFEGSDHMFVQHAMPCVTPKFTIPEGPSVVGLAMKGTCSPFSHGLICEGTRSGRRSAIIPASYHKGSLDWVVGYDPEMKPLYPNPESPEFFLRLKGCGMWLESTPLEFPGITIQPLPSVHFPGVSTDEIRGTAFPGTVSNEMIACQEITKMFDKFGLHHINEPMGFWMYGPVEGDPASSIPKSCSVFKTTSDRRLESHLLFGLERMILNEMTAEEATVAYERICEVYRSAHYEPPSSKNTAHARSDLLWKFEINEFCKNHQQSTEGGEIKLLSKKEIRSRGILPSNDTYQCLEGLTIKGLPLSDLAKTFGRLSWECGRVLSIVHRSGYNWGTYQDHTENATLANAHADNVTLVPYNQAELGDGKYQLLSGLDFDMSFRKEQTVNIWQEVPYPDETFVTKIFSVEFSHVLLNLTGYTASLPGVAKGITPRDPPVVTPNLELIWAMRFLSIWEFPQGYINPSESGIAENDISFERIVPFIKYAVEATFDHPS